MLGCAMAMKRDTSSKEASKKLMSVLKKKATQLKKRTKKEAMLNKVFLAMEEAQRELYLAKTH